MCKVFPLCLILLVASFGFAQELSKASQGLAQADSYFAAGEAGHAIGSYRSFLQAFPQDEHADYAIYRVGQASELATEQLGELIPGDLLTKFNPKLNQFVGLKKFLADKYGIHTDISEGDPYWYYDGRAYQELLKRFPKSQYADDARFLLVERGINDSWKIGGDPNQGKIARRFIAEYEAILKDFPDTNRKAEINTKIAELKKYLPR
jgi:hypothetical protein